MTRAEQSLLVAVENAPTAPAVWLGALRRSGAERFATLGLPTTRLEDWRHTSLAPLAELEFGLSDAHATLDQRQLLQLAGPSRGHRLVFVNGRWRRELSTLCGLPPGVYAGSLAKALVEKPELVEPHLGRLAAVRENALVALNTALLQDGALIHLPEGVAVPEEIELLFVTVGKGGPVITHPRVLLVAGARSEATVVESYCSPTQADPSLTVAVTEVVAGDGARVDHYKLQDEPEGAFHLGVLASRQGRDSRFSTHQSTLGARISRSEVRAVLGGEGGEAQVNGLYLGSREQLMDNHSLIEHASPRCTSRENYKGILDGRSRGVFGGRIRVLEGAQKSDAYQVNSNLLLSEEAEVDTKPQLEIFADDVKCGHGGTVGRLDEEALFYLRSRGVDRESARSILTYAFAGELVKIVKPPGLQRQLARLVSLRLPQGELLREAA
jgi:Fe-S cluster assembly protein SufD